MNGTGGRFDLTDPDQAALAYESVLETARSLDDITAHLNAALWPAIALGMRSATRRAWETAFPELVITQREIPLSRHDQVS